MSANKRYEVMVKAGMETVSAEAWMSAIANWLTYEELEEFLTRYFGIDLDGDEPDPDEDDDWAEDEDEDEDEDALNEEDYARISGDNLTVKPEGSTE